VARLDRQWHGRSGTATAVRRDEQILQTASSGEKTKKAAVTKALTEFIARREQKRILQLFEKFEWNPDFDYKTERSRR
jgi:hypothetical protein